MHMYSERFIGFQKIHETVFTIRYREGEVSKAGFIDIS
jgi:hypothetical protein